MSNEPQSSAYLIRRLFQGYLRPHMRGFIVATIFMGIGAATTGALAKMIEPIVNELGKGHGESYVMGMGLLIIGIFAARGLDLYSHRHHEQNRSAHYHRCAATAS